MNYNISTAIRPWKIQERTGNRKNTGEDRKARLPSFIWMAPPSFWITGNRLLLFGFLSKKIQCIKIPKPLDFSLSVWYYSHYLLTRYMGEFPSGQRGQTVNLLLIASVVRIHLRPFAYRLQLKGISAERVKALVFSCDTHLSAGVVE